LIVFDSGIFTNLDVDAGGVELAVEGHWTNGPNCRLSYTLQGTRDRTSNLELPDSPDNLVKLNVSVPLVPEKLFAGLEVQYTSQRHSWQYLTTANPPIPVQGSDVGGFAVVNFTLFSQNLVKNLDVSASIYNLFDTRYSDPASQFHTQEAIPQDGRAFRFKLTYRF
jgi:outer membrane receptor protein involved in Fe transport